MVERVRDLVVIMAGTLISAVCIAMMIMAFRLADAYQENAERIELEQRCAIPTLRLPECPPER